MKSGIRYRPSNGSMPLKKGRPADFRGFSDLEREGINQKLVCYERKVNPYVINHRAADKHDQFMKTKYE